MSSYDEVLAAFGAGEPITVPVQWGATVVVHRLTVGKYIDSVSEQDQKPIYNMLASAVEVNGEYWSASQWANLPKKAMADIGAIYDAYKQLNGDEGEDEKK